MDLNIKQSAEFEAMKETIATLIERIEDLEADGKETKAKQKRNRSNSQGGGIAGDRLSGGRLTDSA